MILSVILCAVLVLLDRFSKMAAVRWLMPVGVIPAIPGVFEWRYVENTGAAFSFFAGKQLFLIIITSVALLALAWLILFRRPKDKMEYLALIFIFSGGLGNLIDRIARGYVVDYINLTFMNFAVFNLADIFVSIGFVLLVVAVIRAELRTKKQKAAVEAGGTASQAPSREEEESTDKAEAGDENPKTETQEESHS